MCTLMGFGFLLLQCFYFLLPAYWANMAPVLLRKKLIKMAVPIDRGKSWRGQRILGDHKTVRGFVAGIVIAIIVALIQAMMYRFSAFERISLVDYADWSYGFSIVLGLLLGAGALLGDLVKSFIKRRVGIQPGKPFIPFDQLDFTIGALALSALIVNFTLPIIITCIVLSILLHILTNHLAFFFKIRQEKW